jgi:putative SOS response-associated peptidase YedK
VVEQRFCKPSVVGSNPTTGSTSKWQISSRSRRNRCLILADGFFEKGIRFIQPGEPLFAMAGLWADDPHQNGNLLSASTKIPRSRERERMSA